MRYLASTIILKLLTSQISSVSVFEIGNKVTFVTCNDGTLIKDKII